MVKIFLDTANLKEIQEIQGWNIVDGITTNQAIFLKEKGVNFEEHARAILELVHPFPVSLEGPNNLIGIIRAAKKFDRLGFENFVVKVPMLSNGDGLRAVRKLSDLGFKTNVTACMTLNQVFLATLAGATYVSLFYCRMKDWKYKQLSKGKEKDIFVDCLEGVAEQYALDTIKATMKMLNEDKSDTELIVGSIRDVEDITNILKVQPDIITIPYKILKRMPRNEMTEKTLEEFEDAWKEFKRHEKQ